MPNHFDWSAGKTASESSIWPTHRACRRKRIPFLMTNRSRAIGALVLATTLIVVAGCGSSTPTTSATQATPSALASSAASYSAAPTTTSAAPLPDSERWHPAKHLAAAAGWAEQSQRPGLRERHLPRVLPAQPDRRRLRRRRSTGRTPPVPTWSIGPNSRWRSPQRRRPGADRVDRRRHEQHLRPRHRRRAGDGGHLHTTGGEEQAQSLAYSTDHGQTWQEYSDNPVLRAKSSDEPLRDPKVFWYEPGGYWVMVGAVTAAFKVQLYKSKNLTDWTYLSEVSGVGAQAGLWESPDLFPLRPGWRRRERQMGDAGQHQLRLRGRWLGRAVFRRLLRRQDLHPGTARPGRGRRDPARRDELLDGLGIGLLRCHHVQRRPERLAWCRWPG